MKNQAFFIITVVTILVLSTVVLISCSIDVNRTQESITSLNEAEITLHESSNTLLGKETDISESNHLAYSKKMNLESYMRYFVNYFHEPYNASNSVFGDDILTLIFHFCYSNMNDLEFITMEEDTLETSRRILIEGARLRETAKLLLSEEFIASDYHDYLSNSGAEHYDEERDLYIVSTAKDYWGGDLYYIRAKDNLEITNLDDSVIVLASVYTGNEPSQKLEYRFKKVVRDDFLFYQIDEINLVK